MADLIIGGLFVLSGLGFWLFIGLLVASATERFGTRASYLLKGAIIPGALAAALMLLIFIFVPDIALPGPGMIAVIAAMFFAGFAAAVPVVFILRLIRRR